MAERPIQLRTLYSMIVSAPKDVRETADNSWQQESALFALLQQAEAKACDHPEWELITTYWMRERPALASKTRETIDADFTGMFDPLTRGKIGELFGSGTNLTPDDILDRKLVVIDIPIAKYREVGQYAALIWAQLFQRAVDRRSYHYVRKCTADRLRELTGPRRLATLTCFLRCGLWERSFSTMTLTT
jgi:hypothetical protein